MRDAKVENRNVKKKVHGREENRLVSDILINIILLLGSSIMIIPFVWMFLTSFKTYQEAVAVPVQWFPSNWNIDNYREVLKRLDFLHYYRNTIIITIVTLIFMELIASIAAYAFARMEFPGKNAIFFVLMTVFMVPAQMTMIPKYLMITQMHLVDTLGGIVIPNLFSVYTMFMLRQSFSELPRDLEDAARIDGCSYFRTFAQIIMPLSKGSLIAISILNLLWCWNDLLWPLIATSSDRMRVLSVAMASLQGQHGTEYQILMAAGVMTTFPLVIIYIFGQRSFVEGIAFTGVKG
ncbi:MAG: carbohydrate ABC transporter permease [Lachnospiraceae bacterium]|nr:carbohydrate ABC transporter permease [Lachnospiraceae bacterium]